MLLLLLPLERDLDNLSLFVCIRHRLVCSSDFVVTVPVLRQVPFHQRSAARSPRSASSLGTIRRRLRSAASGSGAEGHTVLWAEKRHELYMSALSRAG